MATSPSTSWRNIALAIWAALIASFQIGKAIIALPLLQGAPLHLSLRETGLVLSALAIVGAVLAMPLGFFIARHDLRKVLCTGLVTIAVASLVGGWAENVPVLIASRVLEGMAVVVILVSASSLVGRQALPQDRDQAMALSSTAVPSGIALMMLGATIVANLGYELSWTTLWKVNAALALICMLTLLAFMPAMPASAVPPTTTAVQTQAQSWADLWQQAFAAVRQVATARGPQLIALCFGLYAMVYFAFSGFLPLLLRDLLGLSLIQAGYVSAAIVTANVLGNISAGAMMRRGARPSRIICAGFAIAALCAPLLFWLPIPAAAAIALAFVMIGSLGGIPGALTAIAPKLAPNATLISPTIGFMLQGSYVGQLIGPLAAGSLAQLGGWPLVAALLLPLALAGALLSRKLQPNAVHLPLHIKAAAR